MTSPRPHAGLVLRWAEGDVHQAGFVLASWGDHRFVCVLLRLPTANVVVAENDLDICAGGWGLRGSGLWFSAVRRESDSLWALDLEAHGLATASHILVDERLRGERVPVGFELDVEVRGHDAESAAQNAARVRVDGEMAVGEERAEAAADGSLLLWDRHLPEFQEKIVSSAGTLWSARLASPPSPIPLEVILSQLPGRRWAWHVGGYSGTP